MDQEEAVRLLCRKTSRPKVYVERDLKVLRKMRDDVGFFAKVCFTKGEGWLYEPGILAGYQKRIYDEVCAGHEKTLILVPRGHAKTTLISKIYVLHQALFNKSDYTVHYSSTEKNKRGVAINHRQVFLDPYRFEELHYYLPYLINGPKIMIKANETELVLGNGARIEYVAIMGETRGLSSAGRPSLVVMDDIIPSDAAYSDTVREQVTDSWFSVIRFIGREGCRFIGVGTVLHKDDLWSKISSNRIGGWRHLRLQAYDPTVPEAERDKTILWKERWNWAKLKKIYEEEYVADNKEHLWSREMLNDPATSQTNPFIDVAFLRYSTNPSDSRIIHNGELISTSSCYRVVSIDHSQGVGKDDFVIMVTASDHRGIAYIVDMYASATDGFSQRIRTALRFIRKYVPHKVVIERTSESISFIDVLQEEFRAAGIEYRITQPTPQKYGAKNDRITDRLLIKFNEKRIILPEGEVGSLISEQLRRFDKTSDNNKDDMVDALAWCMTFARQPRPDEIIMEIPRDSMYRVRKRIYETIEKQKIEDETGRPMHQDEPAWPSVRGAC